MSSNKVMTSDMAVSPFGAIGLLLISRIEQNDPTQKCNVVNLFMTIVFILY
jgi:hypothetical protein